MELVGMTSNAEGRLIIAIGESLVPMQQSLIPMQQSLGNHSQCLEAVAKAEELVEALIQQVQEQRDTIQSYQKLYGSLRQDYIQQCESARRYNQQV